MWDPLAHPSVWHSIIRQKAETQWANLPPRFRLSGTLKECTGDAFERDLLASIRLDQLHVLFLLQLAFLDTLTEPDPSILDISDQMLSLVVDTILLRDQLINSGTGLVWKVCLSISRTQIFNCWTKPSSDRSLWPPGCRDYPPFNVEATPHINRRKILMVQNNTQSRYLCRAGSGREHRSSWRSKLRLDIQSDTDYRALPWFYTPWRDTIPDPIAVAPWRKWWLGCIFQPGSVWFRDWLLGEPRIPSFFASYGP